MAEDLLYLARADSGRARARTVPLDLDEVVLHEASVLGDRGVVDVDVHQVSGAQVIGDPDELTRAVRNILDNAERHAASTVRLTLREEPHVVELIVADDGPGVPGDQAERIFERFVRADEARARDHGGTGLGLAISRDIVERHGGTIVLAERDGPGAVFVVRLPPARPTPPASS
jgi:signal transduction histidine kinase